MWRSGTLVVENLRPARGRALTLIRIGGVRMLESSLRDQSSPPTERDSAEFR
jgi:hypothetical protein